MGSTARTASDSNSQQTVSAKARGGEDEATRPAYRIGRSSPETTRGQKPRRIVLREKTSFLRHSRCTHHVAHVVLQATRRAVALTDGPAAPLPDAPNNAVRPGSSKRRAEPGVF